MIDGLKVKRLKRKTKSVYQKGVWIYFQILLGLIVVIAVGGLLGLC